MWLHHVGQAGLGLQAQATTPSQLLVNDFLRSKTQWIKANDSQIYLCIRITCGYFSSVFDIQVPLPPWTSRFGRSGMGLRTLFFKEISPVTNGLSELRTTIRPVLFEKRSEIVTVLNDINSFSTTEYPRFHYCATVWATARLWLKNK